MAYGARSATTGATRRNSAPQLDELLGYFTGGQRVYQGVHAFPAEGLRVPAYVLATGAGADGPPSTGYHW